MVLRRDDDYAAAGKSACDYGDPAARGELVDALARDARALLAALDGPTAGPQARHGRRTRHRGSMATRATSPSTSTPGPSPAPPPPPYPSTPPPHPPTLPGHPPPHPPPR